ncbi:DUF4351 domain-containing protein [Ruania rhizosphaerae]|uniref:DUF4351 domain-containing protein n=1 Tax=Ruania rhizosphaerae TaxID=1840413 RepID=UPI0013581847|nr:DUF4351 domain-containing protein [Ruania rhizosphaerae]
MPSAGDGPFPGRSFDPFSGLTRSFGPLEHGGLDINELRAQPINELRAQPLTAEARLTLVVLKTITSSLHPDVDLAAFTDDLAAVINRSDPHDSGEESLFGLIMRYVLLVGDAPPEDYEALFTRLGPTAREAYMTSTAEQYIQRGRGEGLQQGRAEVQERTRAMLTRLLTQKFGPLPEHHQDRIQHATTDDLDTWTDRILTAATLEDVFR